MPDNDRFRSKHAAFENNNKGALLGRIICICANKNCHAPLLGPKTHKVTCRPSLPNLVFRKDKNLLSKDLKSAVSFNDAVSC